MQHWRHKRKSRNAGSFLRKELGEALRNTEELSKDLTLFLRRLTAPPPSSGRGLWLYIMQHW